MTDRAFEPPNPDPFAQVLAPKEPTNDNDADNQFASIMPKPVKATDQSSTLGAAARGFEKSIIPAIGSFPAIGAGAEAGAALGGAIGGPFAPATALGGGIVGGLAGAFLGSTAIAHVQNWALSKLPDSWREAIGLDERQEQIDQGEHPVASFLGGIAPYALTLRPGAVPKGILPENATALQRIMAHPATARVFGGAAMGGMELGQEAASSEDLDWRKIAISTGFGLVFNRPTKFGERVTEIGARPARRALGIAEPTRAAPAEERAPTIAEAGDAKVVGPGVTESVFQGTAEQAPSAAMTAQEQARTEQAVTGATPRPGPDVHEVARRLAPETFERYDALVERQRELRAWIQEANKPQPEHFAEVINRQMDLEKQLDAHLAARGGYTGGPEARQLRAQIRAAQTEHADMVARSVKFEAGQGEETADLAARKHLMDTYYRLRDLGPEVAAAYRRAAEAAGSHMVEPAAPPASIETAAPAAAPPPATQEAVPGAVTAAAPGTAPAAAVRAGRPIDEQRAFIAQDVARKLAEAGRPSEEAQAAGQLVAARYVTRAGRFNGALGTPEELYRREGAEIRGPGGKKTSPTPPAAPTTPAAIAAEFKPAPRPKLLEEPIPEAEITTTAVTRKGPRGAAARAPDTWSLLEFIVDRGGITPDERNISDLRTIFGTKNKFVPGFGQVIRPAGMSLDRAREAAIESGYLHEGAGINELLEAVDAEARGTKQYRQGHVAPEAKEDPLEREHHISGVLDQALTEAEIDPTTVAGKLRDRVVEIMDKEGVTDPLAAWERAVMEQDEHAVAADHIDPRTEALPGWDVPDDVGPARGEGAAAALERGPGITTAGEAAPAPGAGHPELELAQRHEPGAEGKPQGLLPGVEPVTDAERAQLAANKPLEGGTAPPPAGGLFDEAARDQKEFWSPAKGKIRIREGERPIITLAREADASTFIHETGHQWLEELLLDAEHPQAPNVIKDDADTVLQWLGAHSAEDVKTRHHEKFARGFEQYLREGVAPSPELAGVFQRFKEWLVSLYHTLKGLGKPISEDIRGVFDRMLVEEPRRTVVAQDRPMGPTLADIHRADAAETEPHEAEAVADRVEAEATRAEAELPPQVQHEIQTVEAARQAAAEQAAAGAGAQPATEAGPGQPEPAKVGEPSGGPEPVAGRGAGGEEPSGVVESGAAAPAKGAELSGPGERPAGTAESGHPLAPSPVRLFGPAESPLIDKAGNIRLENLTTDEKIRQAIREAADANDGFIGDRQGVVTDGQVLDLAYDIGMEGAHDLVKKWVVGQAYNAPQIMAIRMLAKQMPVQTAEAMKKAAIGNDADVIAYAKAKAQHLMVLRTLAGITAESGRAQRAFRDISGMSATGKTGIDEFVLRQATGKTLYQLKQEAIMGQLFDTPQAVNKFINDSTKKTFGRMLLEYWINGLISGPATHTTYMVGNTILAMHKAGPETLAAAGIGALRAAMGRPGERVRAGETMAQLSAAVRSLPSTLMATGESFKSGLTTLLPGEEPRALPFQPYVAQYVASPTLNEAATYHDVAAGLFGFIRGLRDGAIAAGTLATEGGVTGSPLFGTRPSHLGAIPDIEVRGMNVLPVGTLARGPGRFIAAIHSFYRSAGYSMNKAAMAYRQAATEGLTGTQFEARVGDLRQNPPPEMMEKSRFEATEQTLMGKGSPFVQALSRLTNTEIAGFPILKLIDPFVHIAGNIIDQSIVQRTPVGLLSAELRADLMGRNGNVAQDTAQARMLVGTAMAVTIGTLAAEGYISGSGPSDPHEAAMWRLAGNQAHSVKIGDTWYAANRLGPLGMLLGISADLYEVVHQAQEGEIAEAAAHLQHAFTQNVLDESFMRGPSELIRALEESDRYGPQYVRNFLSSFVPYSVGMAQEARNIDPYSRQARTIVDAMKAKIPGLSETLLLRRDIWGEPMPSRQALINSGTTSIYTQQISKDPVNITMVALGISPANLPRKIRNVDLDDQQYDDFTRIAGRLTKSRLDAIVRSPDFKTWPPHIQRTVVEEVIKQSREVGRGLLLMKYPQIIRDAVEVRMEKFQD